MRPLRSTASGHLDDPTILGDPHLRRVLDILNPPGEETRLVGGAVRNALLGLPPGDIDLATTMAPDEVMRLAKAAKLRAIPTGIAHGTVTLMSGRHPFEVTTLREDVETDGRHAVVRFGRDFALDAERRDFTMNALSLGPDGAIFDTVGGVADLARGHVKFIGDASTRIREDFLRILRFFRFSAVYGEGPLDVDGLAAATQKRDGLARLSRERVRAEVLKILDAPRAIEVLRVMGEAGILRFILPGAADLDRLDRLVAFDPAPDAPLRLAALAVGHASDIEPLRAALRLTNAEAKRFERATKASAEMAEAGTSTGGMPPSDEALMRLLFVHGREAAMDALSLCAADTAGPPEPWKHALGLLAASSIPALPFGGDDVLRRGLTGAAVGRALAIAKELWIEAEFQTDPAALADLLSRAVETARGQAVS